VSGGRKSAGYLRKCDRCGGTGSYCSFGEEGWTCEECWFDDAIAELNKEESATPWSTILLFWLIAGIIGLAIFGWLVFLLHGVNP